MKKLTTALLASLTLLTGCATSTLNIDPSTNSQALQVARAATLFELRDQEIPQTEFNRLADSTVYNAAWATTMYFNPAKGFSSGSSLALVLPALLFDGKPADSFNHVLAWMPQELAANQKEAQKKMDEILLDALEKTALELGHSNYITEQVKLGSRNITLLAIEDESLNCTLEKGFFCGLGNRLNEPRLSSAPQVLQKYSQQPAYFFPLRKDHTLLFHKRNENLPKQDQLEFLTSYSQNLPDWVYLYIAPKTIHNAQGEQVEYPFMLHQGKVLLFLKPESVS